MWKRQIVHQLCHSLLKLRNPFLARDDARSCPLNYDALTHTFLMTYNTLVRDRKYNMHVFGEGTSDEFSQELISDMSVFVIELSHLAQLVVAD